MSKKTWYALWAVQYVGAWCTMVGLADFQMLYRFNFPAVIPYTILVLAELWLLVGLIEFCKRAPHNEIPTQTQSPV